MKSTHFLLHRGETVRTPRIVLLNWKNDDWQSAQNLWRRLVLAWYSPTDSSGKTLEVPLSLGSGGGESIDSKLATIKALHDRKVPIDTYWIDAGWYGTSPDSMAQRGSWTPNPTFYPNGLMPLGDMLKTDGYGFILWFSPESAAPGSEMLAQHPEWYQKLDPNGAGLVKYGDPAALKGITDTISKVIRDSGVTWLRQDFDYDLQPFWNASDTPDRVGISEIKYITGFYQFWDDLRAQNPGLQIDNCCSGGRRLDIEAISRGR